MGNSSNTNNQQPQQPGFLDRMKNPFYQLENSSITTKSLLSTYNFRSLYDDPYYKECKIIEHKQTKQLLIYKEFIYDDEEEFEAQYQQFSKRRQKFTHPNLIILRQLIKQSTQGLLKDEYKLILLFDYILIDLHTQVHNRIESGKTFSNDEIANILVGTIKGYSSLEKQGYPNDKVRLSNIYFGIQNQLAAVKVVDSNLFPSLNNLQSILNRENQKKDIYLSPEQVFQNISSLKSGVYSLGISMLQVCTLNYSSEIYDYSESIPQERMNLKQVDERLNIVKNKYPLGFYYILREMLQKSSEHRITFKQLEDKIPTNLKNPNLNMNLSVVGKSTKQNSKYIKNTSTSNNTNTFFDNQNMATSKIVPQIIPKENRSQATLTSQYRPQQNQYLTEVNQVYTNGNSYKGQKNSDNQRHGKGKYLYADGSYYYGDWYKNKMCGNGVLYYCDNGVEYDGEWKDDVFEGKGVLYARECDWLKYQGEFKAGKQQGYGVMNFYDGSVYMGGFRNDRPHGKGKMTTKQGRQIIGVWDNGKKIQ